MYNEHALFCISIFMIVLWIMALFMVTGASHLKGTMELLEITQQTAKVLKNSLQAIFLQEQLVHTKSIPPGYNHLSSSVQDTVVDECSFIMSLDQFQRIEHLQKMSTVCKGMDYAFSGTDTQLAVIKNSVASVLRLDEQSGLLAMYRALYGTSINMEDISAYAISSKAVVYAGETIRRGQLVTAKWPLSETHERV